MFARRLRRRPAINLALVQCIVFDGELLFPGNTKHVYKILYNVGTTSSTLVQNCTNVLHLLG